MKNFYLGRPTDFLTDKTTRYPSVFLQDNGGDVSISAKTRSLNFRMFVLDLVNVSEDTKENELDVLSDTLSIAQDILFLIHDEQFQDWKIGSPNNFEFVIEKFDDLTAGTVIDITIETPVFLDKCAIPLNE